MKIKKFKIPIYEYKVLVVEVESKNDSKDVEDILIKNTISKKEAKSIRKEINGGKVNGGYTYRNLHCALFVVIIFPMKSNSQKLNVLGHEKRHIEDRLAEYCNIKDIESMAYLAGYLTEKMFE